MRVDIDKNYCIVSSTYEFTVCKKTFNKKNEEVLIPVPCGHCTSLPSAIKTLLDNTIKQSEAINDLKRVENELYAMKADIDKQLECLDTGKITKGYKKYNKVKFDEEESESEK